MSDMDGKALQRAVFDALIEGELVASVEAGSFSFRFEVSSASLGKGRYGMQTSVRLEGEITGAFSELGEAVPTLRANDRARIAYLSSVFGDRYNDDRPIGRMLRGLIDHLSRHDDEHEIDMSSREHLPPDLTKAISATWDEMTADYDPTSFPAMARAAGLPASEWEQFARKEDEEDGA